MQLQNTIITIYVIHPDLLLPGDTPSPSARGVSGLHLQHCLEHVLRGLSQEAYLGIGVEPVQVRGLRRQVLIHIGTVADVVRVGRGLEPRGIHQLVLQLEVWEDYKWQN